MVPFTTLAAGISGAISAARSEVEPYKSELVREESEIAEKYAVEAAVVDEFFRHYGLTDQGIRL